MYVCAHRNEKRKGKMRGNVKKYSIPAYFPSKTTRYDERKDFKCLTLYTRTGRHSCFIFQVQKYGGLTFLEQEVEKEAVETERRRFGCGRDQSVRWHSNGSRRETSIACIRLELVCSGVRETVSLKKMERWVAFEKIPSIFPGAVARSIGRSCMHALHTQLSYMLAYAGRDTVTLRAIASIRTESSRCASFQFLSKAWGCFVITRFGLCARSLFAPLDSNYTLLTRLTDGRPLYAD